jgi:hypothetical protein
MSPVGYDGNGYGLGDRVELHPGCDLWMRGCRYGTVLKVPSSHRMGGSLVTVKADNGRRLRWECTSFRFVSAGGAL